MCMWCDAINVKSICLRLDFASMFGGLLLKTSPLDHDLNSVKSEERFINEHVSAGFWWLGGPCRVLVFLFFPLFFPMLGIMMQRLL